MLELNKIMTTARLLSDGKFWRNLKPFKEKVFALHLAFVYKFC